jgi:hypothetical protein
MGPKGRKGLMGQKGHYYTAPTRHWAFDWNFQNLNLIPPLTPLMKNYISP